MTSKKYTLAEFFCGCGGTSRGFTRSGRFNVAFGNDVKNEALRTFEFNHARDDVAPATVRKDIRLLDVQTIHDNLKDRGIAKGDLDCMIGGPPCQGFSQLRRNEHREKGKIVKFSGYSQLAHDPRNDLVLRYLEVAEALRPKFLVIENVPQMLNHGFDGRLGKLSEIVIQMLEKDLGYKVEVAVVNCADYGVPQLRERAIFIASSIGPASFPKTSHADPKNKGLLKDGRLPWVTVRDAIGDLPAPPLGDDSLGGQGIALYGDEPSTYAQSMRSNAAFPFNHITRGYKKSVLDIIKHMRPGQTWDAESERMRAKYARSIAKHSKIHGVNEERTRIDLERTGALSSVNESGDEDADRYSEKKFFDSIRPTLKGMERQLESVLRSPFLGQVAEATLARPESMVFHKHPLYSRFDKLCRLLNGGLSFAGNIVPIGMKETSLLYEYWCFLKIVDLLRENFDLEEQTVVQVNRLRTTVALSKGKSSAMLFTHKPTGKPLYVVYNRLFNRLPTIAQKPDNVIQFTSHDKFYIFDAKYRIQFDHDYIKLYGGPGPATEDVNTMHRYRDAIAIPHPMKPTEYKQGVVSGAVVLFPYPNETLYREHKFYKSISQVEIGGLPFLPGSTTLVRKKLDTLLASEYPATTGI